ncbi:MAG TPA: serine hydrolase domain-containing protein [Candidatus Acidoferrum sp.]|jgi:CubicO group peptidase (beta-lactamase class C family)|nr:serine hydrolase domain-containing protein [Candidatus Acidoferrum sp.]
MKRSVALIALLVLIVPGVAWPQGLSTATPEAVGLSSPRLARVTEAVKGEIAKGRYPGAVALVARRGKVAYFEALGQRDPQTGAPMTKDAIFRLYSMTKPFTSVATMMLLEDGRLLLNDPVSKYIPKLKGLQVSVPRVDTQTGKVTYALVPAEREMTIQDLLRHTSGLVYGGFTSHTGVKEAYTKEGVDWNGVTAAEQIDRLARVPLAHQPGTAWEYSLSTDVLGRVVEAVSGVTLGQFFQERIFTPLKMTDTTFLVPNGKVVRLAQPFAKDPVTGAAVALLDVTQPQKNDAGGAGTAGTVMDYARFSQMLLNGGQLDRVRLLGRATVAQMSSDHLGDIRLASPILPRGYGFGLGFAVRRETGLNWVTGSAGEYRWGGAGGTAFWVDPKEQMVVVWMTQGQPGARRGEDRDLFRQLVQAAILD